MELVTNVWVHLFLRWLHVFAGILWIGSTYFFTWLDGRFHEPNAEQVWMVHSGGFYVVEKKGQPSLQFPLHWFRWEAAITWLSGFLLLFVVYHLGGALVDPSVRPMSTALSVAVTLGLLVVGWLVYDTLWKLLPSRLEMVGVVLCYLLLVGLDYGLTRVFSSRGSYIHIGALMGTLMAANVWMLILPAQRRMIAAVKAGQAPDRAEAERAKQRSRHNTFMVMPLVFIMISNHFPTATYGSDYNWLVLAVLILVGWAAAYFVRRA
jgi:uncharacterized membrane protein